MDYGGKIETDRIYCDTVILRLQMVCLTINTFVSGISYFYDVDVYNFCFWLFLCFIFIFIVFTFVSLPVYVPHLWAVF